MIVSKCFAKTGIVINHTTFVPRACVRTWNVTLRQACIEKIKFCISLMLADKIFTCVAPIVSESEQAMPATSILYNARKSVGSGSVFSLSFRSFFLFLFATKEKEKNIKKTFYFKIVLLLFLLFCDKRRKSKQKEETTHCFLKPYGCGLNGCSKQSLHFHAR